MPPECHFRLESIATIGTFGVISLFVALQRYRPVLMLYDSWSTKEVGLATWESRGDWVEGMELALRLSFRSVQQRNSDNSSCRCCRGRRESVSVLRRRVEEATSLN